MGDTVFKIPDSREMKQEYSLSSDETKVDYTVGTFLAHRIEELGVKDFFAVPGKPMLALFCDLPI